MQKPGLCSAAPLTIKPVNGCLGSFRIIKGDGGFSFGDTTVLVLVDPNLGLAGTLVRL